MDISTERKLRQRENEDGGSMRLAPTRSSALFCRLLPHPPSAAYENTALNSGPLIALSTSAGFPVKHCLNDKDMCVLV
jgi:hypothetical protein